MGGELEGGCSRATVGKGDSARHQAAPAYDDARKIKRLGQHASGRQPVNAQAINQRKAIKNEKPSATRKRVIGPSSGIRPTRNSLRAHA